MQNAIKKMSLTILSLFLIVGSSLAQVDAKADKSEKKCDGECCSNKMTDAKMDHSNMIDHWMMDVKSMDKNNDGSIYQCPMHANQISDKPGECSECGMDLKKVSIKDAEKKLGHKNHDMMNNKIMDHTSTNAKSNIDVSSIDKNKDGKVFQCPMKCELPQDKPGECSKCGMDLKEISTKEAQEKSRNHKH
jgi:Cu(I)/Ag(I) efflux system membrane fusion protein